MWACVRAKAGGVGKGCGVVSGECGCGALGAAKKCGPGPSGALACGWGCEEREEGEGVAARARDGGAWAAYRRSRGPDNYQDNYRDISCDLASWNFESRDNYSLLIIITF